VLCNKPTTIAMSSTFGFVGS